MKILAVDDDLVARSLLNQALHLAGYSDTVVIDSAEAALHRIKVAESPVECFLLDIQMEGMDGIQLCRNIRAMSRYRETPIIMVTAMHEKSNVDAAFAAGATDYVTKPFDMLELGARLRIAENINDKLAKIRRLGSEYSAPSEAADSIPAVHTPVRFSDIDQGFVEFADFEAALRHLTKRKVMALSILTWRTPGFRTIEKLGSETAISSLVNAVAFAVSEAFEAFEYLASHHCNGVYIGVFGDRIPTDGDFARAQDGLNRTISRQFDEFPPFIELKFGQVVRFSAPTADDPLALVRSEVQGAHSDQKRQIVDDSALSTNDNGSVAAQAVLQDSLEKLRPYYLATLNKALGDLDTLSNKIVEKKHPADVRSIADITHKIAGVAPMLGFEDLGKMAASLERVAVENLAEGSRTHDSDVLNSELNRLLDGIENELVLGY